MRAVNQVSLNVPALRCLAGCNTATQSGNVPRDLDRKPAHHGAYPISKSMSSMMMHDGTVGSMCNAAKNSTASANDSKYLVWAKWLSSTRKLGNRTHSLLHLDSFQCAFDVRLCGIRAPGCRNLSRCGWKRNGRCFGDLAFVRKEPHGLIRIGTCAIDCILEQDGRLAAETHTNNQKLTLLRAISANGEFERRT
jgi:hypothetical protein